MVTYFYKKDLVSFGTYLMSKKRRDRFDEAYKESIRNGANNPLSTDERLKLVNHADIENWIDEQRDEKLLEKAKTKMFLCKHLLDSKQ